MTPHEFIAKWKPATLTEMQAYQQHFLDLCELLGEKKPAEVDPTGSWFTFQKGVTKTGGGKGFADVWRRGFFGWEYKGKHKNLDAAYQQLLRYHEALLNPPLLIVCDLDRFEIHTKFPNHITKVYRFDLDGLADPGNVKLLRSAFTAPEDLKPGTTQEQVTREIADRFCKLADGLRARHVPADRAAHFLMKLMFCMFAEDIDLLPRGLFTRTLTGAKADPARLSKLLRNLFESMAAGEPFGADEILRFNGGLFADADVIELEKPEIAELLECALCDWSQVEPSIFGTLFERILDPDKRAQLGAHYTSRDDIETLLGPVLSDPLRREWDEVRGKAEKLYEAAKGKKIGNKEWTAFERHVNDFRHRLSEVTVLDPACGSGNFLYVALNMLLDLEKEVLTYMASRDQRQRLPSIRPAQVRGLERNTYARELAQVVIWIGFLQWNRFNGFQGPTDPVLDQMENIRCTDAILDLGDPDQPREPTWPAAEFIVGNPQFLGGKMLRSNLGDDYVEKLFRVYGGGSGRVRPEADLCCYWFEKTRAMVEAGSTKRAGLLATQGIRGGANREVLNRIKQTGDLFFAVSDREWVLDGANVHISMVGFDDGSETNRVLDGKPVPTINANLTATADITKAKRFAPHHELCFMADIKGGAFDISEEVAVAMLSEPNPHGRPNSDVLTPWVNGLDVTRRTRRMWIVDFGVDRSEDQAALYEAPFEYTRLHVYPERKTNKRAFRRLHWWLHAETHPAMRQALAPLPRFVATTTVSKYRLFVWEYVPTLPDHQLIAFARSDDYFFGVLHSRVHEVWARAQGTQVRERESGFRYTPTTCFETFPFPEPTVAQREAVAAAARELDGLRANWLNPPEWTRTEVLEFPGSADGPWKRYVRDVDPARGVGTVRYPRTVPKDAAAAAKLKARTLTNLYNESPAWLTAAHRRLDEGVFAAYGWPADLSDDELLARLLALNLSRAGTATPAAAGVDEE